MNLVHFYTACFLCRQSVIHLIAYEKNMTYITSPTPGLPVYYPVTSHKTAQKYAALLPAENDISMLVSSGRKSGIKYPLNNIRLESDAGKATPNILIILFEGWRYDAMTSDVTPNICELATKATVCLDHFRSGNSTDEGIFQH